MSDTSIFRRLRPISSVNKSQVWMGLVVFVSLVFGLFVLPRIQPREGRSGTPVPEFSLPIVAGGDAGNRISLQAQRGKVVVLDFWATWCGPCTEQTRILERFVATSPGDVQVIGVNEGEEPELLRKYFEQHTAKYPIVSDVDEQTGQVFRVQGLPTLAIIDRAGKFSSVSNGVVAYARLARLVAEASREH